MMEWRYEAGWESNRLMQGMLTTEADMEGGRRQAAAMATFTSDPVATRVSGMELGWGSEGWWTMYAPFLTRSRFEPGRRGKAWRERLRIEGVVLASRANTQHPSTSSASAGLINCKFGIALNKLANPIG